MTEFRRLGELDLEQHLTDPVLKQQFVTPMFEIIAPRYDDFTRVFSLGMDRRWKRELLSGASAALPPGGVALDLACGTGDLALGLAKLCPESQVAGLDVSPRMLALAEERRRATRAANVSFHPGDMMRIELPDASVDLVLAGYAFRNTPDFRVALGEAARVLKPGGALHVLDFYLPAARVWRAAFVRYLRLAGNAVGWLWHREPVVYGYIAASVRHYVTAREFCDHLLSAGFEEVDCTEKLGGGIALHAAERACA